MLKLIIADDEHIICETIYKLIDWKSLDIEVVGVCYDGIEAYNMILDCSPDIVLTDIKMPGLSGLQLLSKIHGTDKDIEFIILSGYSDFNFAKEAMKYGVKQYLLKPCNENQIIEALLEVRKNCYMKKTINSIEKINEAGLEKSFIKNLLFEYLINNTSTENMFKQYEHIINFKDTSYELCFIYFLEEKNLEESLRYIYTFFKAKYENLPTNILYVKNVLILFFKNCDTSYSKLDLYISSISFIEQTVPIEYKRQSYKNLIFMMNNLLKKLRNYEKILLIDNNYILPILNHNALVENTNLLFSKLTHENIDIMSEIVSEFNNILYSITDIGMLKIFTSNILIRLSSTKHSFFSDSKGLIEYLEIIDTCSNIEEINNVIFSLTNSFYDFTKYSNSQHTDFIQKIIKYVKNNLSNPNLSLKWIAENYIFMNVDYLSKQFVKKTGEKFSTHLTNIRMEKAKELLLNNTNIKIQTIAEQVGCGDNPQYFSQIFKKYTGYTPSNYTLQRLNKI